MVRYSVVRRTLAGRATLPISRSNPPESAPSDRTARSGSERMYLYRTGVLTLCSIRGRPDVPGGPSQRAATEKHTGHGWTRMHTDNTELADSCAFALLIRVHPCPSVAR